jgi:hypothetical protein
VVEGARLESVYRGNSIEGSNPSLSAIWFFNNLEKASPKTWAIWGHAWQDRVQMALNLYRRHGSNCIGGRPLDGMRYESDETRRNWKNCFCPICASGTLLQAVQPEEHGAHCGPEAVASAW